MLISLESIKQLRQETGAGVLDGRRALRRAEGVYAQALALLGEQARQEAAKRASNQASQGRIELYSHAAGRIGVMVEINCETDFTACSEVFCNLAHELALQIAAAAPRYVQDEDIPQEVLAAEAQKAAERARQAGKREVLIERIVEGHLEKYKDQWVLLRQVYIRDDHLTIAQVLSQAAASVGEKVAIRRFARWELAEGEEN